MKISKKDPFYQDKNDVYNEVLKQIQECRQKGGKKLDFYFYNLTKIPREITKLETLTDLNICEIEMSKIPGFIGNITSLKKLIVGSDKYNLILPSKLGNLHNLESLSIYDGISDIPDWVFVLKNLKKLIIHSNTMKTIPSKIHNLKKLKHLEINANEVNKIPDTIGNCPLEHLEITGNFKTIPESLGNLTKLKSLTIFSRALTNLPENIGNLKNLKKLNIDAYNVKILPLSFKKLSYVKDKNICIKKEKASLLKQSLINKKLYILPCFNKLKNMDYQFRWKLLETYTLKELESILRSAPDSLHPTIIDREIFKDVLLERKVRLKKSFKWTEENKKRIINVSDNFLKTWNDGITKSKKMLKTLPVSDINYHVSIILYPDISFDNITNYLNCELELSLNFNYNPLKDEKIEIPRPLHVKRDLSWNIEGLDEIELKDGYICYALHVLFVHNSWALQDIVNIHNIETKIRILY